MSEARCVYTHMMDGPFVLVVDEDRTGASVAYDAEAVVIALARQLGPSLGGRRVLYRDKLGLWDEILVARGEFVGFRRIGARDREEAIRLASRQWGIRRPGR